MVICRLWAVGIELMVMFFFPLCDLVQNLILSFHCFCCYNCLLISLCPLGVYAPEYRRHASYPQVPTRCPGSVDGQHISMNRQLNVWFTQKSQCKFFVLTSEGKLLLLLGRSLWDWMVLKRHGELLCRWWYLRVRIWAGVGCSQILPLED